MSTGVLEPRSLLQDPGYSRLKDYVVATTGLAYFVDRDTELVEHLNARMKIVGTADCRQYLELLQDPSHHGTELDSLVERLTIGETSFFRHSQLFDALRQTILPATLERNRDSRRLRIWCAGCSIGAEVYSMSILLRRYLAEQIAGWQIDIIGTDINRGFLATAAAGCFSDWTLRATPGDIRRDCFLREGEMWRIKPEFRAGVSFQHHNLVSQPFPSLIHELCGFDIVLCRNVMIYFSPEIVDGLIDRLHDALVPEGFLLVGHAEANFERFVKFRHLNVSGVILYQKSPPTPASRPVASPRLASCHAHPPAPHKPRSNFPRVERNTSAGQEHASCRSKESTLLLVRTLADQGQLDQAARMCARLVTEQSSDSAAHFLYGLILEQQARYEEAEHWLTRAVCLDRQNPLIHYHRGRVLARCGQTAQAAQGYRCVLELIEPLDPDQALAQGDGLTVGDLDNLARMHLDCLEITP